MKTLRLDLLPAPLELTAAAASADAGDGGAEPAAPRRQLAGVAVPYEIEARVGFQLVTFAAGSIEAARSPLLLGHDPNRPVGVLASSEQTATALRATFAVDETSDGDAALVQAKSGSRAGLSVGVDVQEYETIQADEPDGPERIRVTAGRLAETSLVALAAFSGANVDTVAASKPTEGAKMPETPPKPPEPETPENGDDDDANDERAPRRPALVIADRPLPAMRLGEYIQTYIQAEKGDRAAGQRIEAALNRGDVTTSPGVVPIAYVQTIIDSLGADRPLFGAMAHAEMPASGMTIRAPAVTTRPDGNWLADDTGAAIPTGPVVIGDADVPVKQWAWAGAASVALVERSSPSYIEEVFSQAVKSYYRDVETDIAAGFPAATGGPATVGAAVAAYSAAYRTAPTLLVCGGDAYGKLLDAVGVLMFTSGSADASGSGTYAGLRVVSSPDVAAGDAWVTAADFQTIRESSPIRLSVSNVESLSLEIAVTAFYARQQTRQTIGAVGGAVGIPAFVPVGMAAQSQSSGRSK